MKGNLLIIDDEELILENTSMLMEDLADSVKTFLSAKDALDWLETNTAHCIICDLNMPEMDGMEFAKILLQERKADVPVIFYTGHGNQTSMKQAHDYGVYDFLNKPNFDSLEAIVPFALRVGLGEKVSRDEIPVTSKYQELLSKNLL